MQSKAKTIKIIRSCHGSLNGTSAPVPTLLISQEDKIKYTSDLVTGYSSSAADLILAFI